MSPTNHDRARSIPSSAAARISIPGAGFRQSQATAYSGTDPSGWCGQKENPASGTPNSASKARSRSSTGRNASTANRPRATPDWLVMTTRR